MSWKLDNFTPSLAGRETSNSEPFIRGSEYLQAVSQLALLPSMVDVQSSDSAISFGQALPTEVFREQPMGHTPREQSLGHTLREQPLGHTLRDRETTYRVITWIGKHIDAINAELNACLEACHGCFHPEQRRLVRVLAAPLDQRFGIDGLCNILIEPMVILVDVGRIGRQDWLSIVAHEYAHAHLGFPGHDWRFLEVMAHLCLGLGLEPPPYQSKMDLQDMEAQLRNWPPYHSKKNPLAFWMGYI